MYINPNLHPTVHASKNKYGLIVSVTSEVETSKKLEKGMSIQGQHIQITRSKRARRSWWARPSLPLTIMCQNAWFSLQLYLFPLSILKLEDITAFSTKDITAKHAQRVKSRRVSSSSATTSRTTSRLKTMSAKLSLFARS